MEEKCFIKQRDQRRAKEEMHSQEQCPFPPSDPPVQKLTLSKCHQIRADKWIAALVLKLSQKHLTQAEENNCLELTMSADFSCELYASKSQTTTNKPSNSTSDSLQESIQNNTDSYSNSSLALDATAQPFNKRVSVEADAMSIVQGGVSEGSKGSEGAMPDAKFKLPRSVISNHHLKIQQKV